jgi:cytochrome c553
VWPLLDRACVKCHGPEKQKGELRLDSRTAALAGGESGPALVPGKPAESLLLKLIRHADPERERMPPKEKLHDAEVADVEQWIASGAPWPEQAVQHVAVPVGEKIGDVWSDPRNPIVKIFGGRRLDLWSLKPIQNSAPPTVEDESWPRNEIDRFILAKTEAAEQHHAPEADRRTLARRLFFDLTGLPPAPDELNAFLSDESPAAYERLVDRLLASSRYGEHWARMWLDVIRYSDSNGFDWDEFRPQAWRFRDYVVRSLNADKPFAEFIREQLAGDELVAGAPRDEAEQDRLIATGFLRLGPHDNSAASFGEEKKVRQQLMADLVETTGAAFLGLTMSCCRCHDHKYDPLSHADHYRLQAFFEAVKPRDDLPLDRAEKQEAIRRANAELDKIAAEQKEKIEALLAPSKARLRDERVAQLSSEEKQLLELPQEKQDDATKGKLKAVEEKVKVRDKEVRAGLEDAAKEQLKQFEKAAEALEKKREPFTTGLVMMDGEGEPPQTRVLDGGNLDQPRQEVVPGFLSALDPNPATLPKPAREKSTGRRTALAEWIVSEQNPLTARVLVNRVWQSYFGEGIVTTPNDFGLAGAAPAHPELLDWLAQEFRRSGWSLKKLHRLIVTSATYRQSSTISSGEGASSNPLLTRQNPRRLTAEMLRDSMLAVSGRLLPHAGGPPIWPQLPEEVLRANPAFLDDNKEKTKAWYPSPPETTSVRSLFLIQKRTVPVPMMAAFDLPDNAVSCARRNISTVAPQALTLLNSPLARETAHALAERVSREAGDDPTAQVERVFALALQRPPADSERAAGGQFRQQHSLAELCRAILNVNEFVYLD